MLNKNRNNIILNDIITVWLKGVKISCKQSTYSSYEYTVEARIIPKLGNIKIKDIDDSIMNDFTISLFKDNLKEKTIKDILIILKQILNYANIKVNIKMPRLLKREIKILSKEDQVKIEEEILRNITEYNVGIYLSLYTGLRIGEICGLKWKDIDLVNYTIKIEKTLIRVKKYEKEGDKKTKVILSEPKTSSSLRIIPIPRFLGGLLLKLKKENNCFFLTGNEQYIEPRTYYNYYKKFLNMVDIDKKYTFHTLRHTFATRCIELGCDPKTLSEILGHANVKITLDRYVHPSFDNKVKLMNSLYQMV